jgi:hypothetical protein
MTLNPIKRISLAILLVAALGAALFVSSSPRWPIWLVGEIPFPKHSVEFRLETAHKSISTNFADYDEIAKNPERAAVVATDRGDFRFIRWSALAMFGESERFPPPFPGVICSVPRLFDPLMMRSEWVTTYSDVPSLSPTTPVRDPTVAVRYNQAVLKHPKFPRADVCIQWISQPKGDLIGPPFPALSLKTPQFSAWNRIGARQALPEGQDQQFSIAVRNATTARGSASAIDTPDAFGMTALGWAAARSSRETIAKLLALRADPWFGDWCYPRFKREYRATVALGNAETSPLGVAASLKRTDVVKDMLKRVPRKKCGPPAAPGDSALEAQLDVIRAIGAVLKSSGLNEVYGRLLSDFLDKLPSAKGDPYYKYAYDVVIDEAWKAGLSAIFRTRDDVTPHRMKIVENVSEGSLEELNFWTKRLDLSRSGELGPIIASLASHAGEPGDHPAELRKLHRALQLTAGFNRDDKARVLIALFRNGAGGNAKDPAKMKSILAALARHGYDYNAPPFSGDCTLFMRALSSPYDEREACRDGLGSPSLALTLLEMGADVEDRSAALELARRRAAIGPFTAGRPDRQDWQRVAETIARRLPSSVKRLGIEP